MPLFKALRSLPGSLPESTFKSWTRSLRLPYPFLLSSLRVFLRRKILSRSFVAKIPRRSSNSSTFGRKLRGELYLLHLKLPPLLHFQRNQHLWILLLLSTLTRVLGRDLFLHLFTGFGLPNCLLLLRHLRFLVFIEQGKYHSPCFCLA